MEIIVLRTSGRQPCFGKTPGHAALKYSVTPSLPTTYLKRWFLPGTVFRTLRDMIVVEEDLAMSNAWGGPEPCVRALSQTFNSLRFNKQRRKGNREIGFDRKFRDLPDLHQPAIPPRGCE